MSVDAWIALSTTGMIDQPGAVALRALAAISRVMFSHGSTGSLPPRRRASRTTRIVHPELSRSQVHAWLCSPVRRHPQEPSRPRWPCPAPLCHARPWALDHGRQMQPNPESFTLADAFERGWHVTGHCARCSEPRAPDLGEVVPGRDPPPRPPMGRPGAAVWSMPVATGQPDDLRRPAIRWAAPGNATACHRLRANGA
jgi:hypothetical protein